MESERILRTSVFGGFRRTDVLEYVEELKGEIAALSDKLKAQTAQISELGETVDELSDRCAKTQETEEKLAQTADNLEKAESENAALKSENEALTARFLKMDTEKSEMQRKAEEIRASEAQLGAAFLDARKYSDEIVTAANKKANETSLDASESIAQQATEVARLSSDVDALAATLTKSIDELHANIAALSVKLSKSAQALSNRKDAEKFVPDISMKIEEFGEEFAALQDNSLTVLQNGTQGETQNTIYRFDATKEG